MKNTNNFNMNVFAWVFAGTVTIASCWLNLTMLWAENTISWSFFWFILLGLVSAGAVLFTTFLVRLFLMTSSTSLFEKLILMVIFSTLAGFCFGMLLTELLTYHTGIIPMTPMRLYQPRFASAGVMMGVCATTGVVIGASATKWNKHQEANSSEPKGLFEMYMVGKPILIAFGLFFLIDLIASFGIYPLSQPVYIMQSVLHALAVSTLIVAWAYRMSIKD